MWAPDTGAEIGYSASLEFQREYQRTKKERQVSRFTHCLSVPERDRQFHLVLQWKATTLSPRHSSHLIEKRQLTTEEVNWLISQKWVRTWEPGIKAPVGIKADLPGISPKGFLLGMPGFVVAALDPDGHITGMQIATLLDDPKYIWLSSANQGGNGPQLPNGELPLFCWKHSNTPSIRTVILCEGALKSMLVALFLWRLGHYDTAVIGTASAARYGSKTLQDYLNRLGACNIKLMPDAGTLINPQIAQANAITLDLCSQWGYQVEVGEWGQLFDKAQPDFDELLAANRENEVRLKSTSEYLALLPPDSYTSSFKGEPDTQAYAEYILWEEEQKRVEEAEVSYGFTRWLKRLLKKYKPLKGFGPKPNKKPVELPPVIHYKPGIVPQRSQCNGIPPKIIYKKGERLLLWREAVLAGWQHILDTSAPGLGKSHTAGLMEANHFGVEQLWYFAEQPRNVTTPSVQANFTYLEPRHNGLKKDVDPTGKTYLRRPKAGETPDTIGNCHRAELFVELYAKNLPFEGTDNPVCASCHLSGACRGSVGAGFGHRRKRFLTFKSQNLLAHLDSTPGDDFDWSKTGLIFDEALRIIKPIKSVEVRLKDVEQTLAGLALNAPEINSALAPLFQRLVECLSGKEKLPRYGYKDAKVRQLFWDALVLKGQSCELACTLEDAPTDSLSGQSCEFACTLCDSPLTPQILKAATVLEPDLSFLQEPDGISAKALPSKWKALAFRANQILRQQSYQEMASQAKNVPLNWLVSFLEVLSGTVRGSLQLEYGQLTIAYRNHRHSDTANSAAWNIYLDGTASRKYLGLWLDVPEKEILQVEQVQPSYNNLSVIQVNGLGLAGKERSVECDRKIAALVHQFRQEIPDIVIEDWKDKLPPDEPLHENGKARYLAKFRDTRGANYATEAPALASFGIPYQNIGSLELLYTVLTGQAAGKDELEFQEFVDWTVQSEIIQTVGRLRSHLRPHEQLKYYFCADYDLSFLLEHSIKVTTLDAFEITPLAGTPTQIGRWEVLKLLSKALETGQDIQKISQAEIAQALGITQGRISQLFSSIGGWKSFKKLLVPLLENLKGRLINCNWRDMSFLRTTLELPLKESLPQVANQVGIGGWKDFAEIIAIASSDIQIGLIGLLLDLPNLLLLNELAAMFLPPDTRALSTSSSDNFSQDRAIFHKNR
jgi:transcriptional regulator with XRE-family HTH domain